MICNPNSTSQHAGLFRQIVPMLREVEGLTMLVKHTHYAGHAEEMVRGLTRDDFDAVIAVGGDGTVNEIANGLLGEAGKQPAMEEIPALAVIPTGSANVFVRALGFPSSPIEAAYALAQVLNDDLRRPIRLGTWNDRWFAVNAGFGLDADVLARVDKAREQGFAATPLRYLTVATKAYRRAHKRPPRINVKAMSKKGEKFEIQEAPLMLASNTNPWTFLGPLEVVTNPRNSFDNGLGLFGLTNLDGVGGIVGLLYLFGVDRGQWLQRMVKDRVIQFDDAVSVELTCPSPHRFQADGEFEGKSTSVKLTSVADAIEVFAPYNSRQLRRRPWTKVVRDFVRVH